MEYSLTDDLDFSKLKCADTIKFTCIKCGAAVSIQKRKFTEPLCRQCKLQAKRAAGAYKDAAAKQKATCLKRYGVTCPANTQEYKDKLKQQNLDLYGTEYFFQSAEFQVKR